jgi:hypothetical protein
MARAGITADALCSVCVEACAACASECRRHAHMKHCAICAEACGQCAQICRQMLEGVDQQMSEANA